MPNIKSTFSYTIKSKMFRFLSLMILSTSQAFVMEYELPSDLKRLGLANPKDFDACRTLNHPHPILSYHLDTSSIEEMKVQYQVALQAKNANNNTIALKILWDLAERGYAPANRDLSQAFLYGRLGMRVNIDLAMLFQSRPSDIESMIKTQNSVRYSWENKEALENLVQQARNALYPSCRAIEVLKGNNDDTSSDTTCRDSGSSTESFQLEITDGDMHSNPLLSGQQVASKKKDD